MLMLVGETDGCPVLFLALGVTERQPSSPKWERAGSTGKHGRADAIGKMGLTVRRRRAVGEDSSPGEPSLEVSSYDWVGCPSSQETDGQPSRAGGDLAGADAFAVKGVARSRGPR
jgi:hypothetical protein